MFYMGKFAGATPKRHRLWSCSGRLIDGILEKAGYMSRAEMNCFSTKLVDTYTDGLGVKRHVGKKKELRASQTLDLMPTIFVDVPSIEFDRPTCLSLRTYTAQFGTFLASLLQHILQAPRVYAYVP